VVVARRVIRLQRQRPLEAGDDPVCFAEVEMAEPLVVVGDHQLRFCLRRSPVGFDATAEVPAGQQQPTEVDKRLGKIRA
jgi:hypothetical protein